MCQFEKLGLWALATQSLDHPKADATPAVNCDPLRFVDDQHGLVLEENRQIDPLLGRLVNFALWPFGNTDGRDTQIVAGAQPIGGIDPPAIHPHFTTTQNAVDMTLGNALAAADQKIIQALALFLIVNHDMRD